MKRSINFHLDHWLHQLDRKPLIVLGARQIGKTYSLREFGATKFTKVHEFNFQSNRKLHKIFSGDLDTKRIIRELEFVSDTSIVPNGQELIFFDEIQECPEALTSLKYFCENLPEIPLVAAGSLLGLHLAPSSFPVGKVDIFHMFPMSFQEFVETTCSERESAVFREGIINPKSLSEVAHEKFWLLFKCYLITGGLPESITTWQKLGGVGGGVKAFAGTREKLATIITSYMADISKHAGKINGMHIERVWKHIPQQLAAAVDEATGRFKFKDVVAGTNSYRDLIGPIDWLQKSGLLLNVSICHSIASPIGAYTKHNIFKLYMFDCGILGAMLSMPIKTVMDFDFGSYKGFYAENFVAQEILAGSPSPANPITLHSWSEGRAEIEFIFESDTGITPVEVKSGNRIRAKSLKSYVVRYTPKQTVILSARRPSVSIQNNVKLINLPLYFAGALNSL